METNYIDIVTCVLQGDIWAPYLFIIYLDYLLWTSIDLLKENGFKLSNERSRRYPAQTYRDVDYADHIALLANTTTKAKSLLHNLKQIASDIAPPPCQHVLDGIPVFNQRGDISTLLKMTYKFTYLGGSVSSTANEFNTRQAKAWTDDYIMMGYFQC